MADASYDEFRNAILGAPTHSVPDLNTDNFRIGLRDEGVTAINLATQIDLADVVTAHVAESSNLASLTVGVVAVGVFDHADVTFTAVTGASVESLDYFKETGTDSTSPLLWNIDSATGLPVTPNGGNITWAPHASGVYRQN